MIIKNFGTHPFTLFGMLGYNPFNSKQLTSSELREIRREIIKLAQDAENINNVEELNQ